MPDAGALHRVFAYGSNMHLGDLARWTHAHGFGALRPHRVERARLRDHALAWNYRSPSRGGGAASVVASPGEVLPGLVLHVDDALLVALDAKEGHPQRYDRGAAPIAVLSWDRARAIDAWLYRVTPAWTSPETVPPRASYLRLLVEAAEEHGLGDEHVASLRAVPTAT